MHLRTLLLIIAPLLLPTTWVYAQGAGETEASATAESEADIAAQKFTSRCSGCHTIGGGATSSGPDLVSSTQWDPSELKPAVERMEKKAGPINPDDVEMFVKFLKDPNVRERLDAEKARVIAEGAARYQPNADIGRDLFRGTRTLENGGMACAACHQVHGYGGIMAPDLTLLANTRGEVALVSAIEKASFDVMRTAYEKHPITTEEAYHLAAYFQVQADGITDAPDDAEALILPLGGTVLGLIFFGVLSLFTSRRTGGTRARLVRNAQRK